jgi:hypothetical protein
MDQNMRAWTGFVSGLGPVVDSCEHGNELSSSKKDKKCLD